MTVMLAGDSNVPANAGSIVAPSPAPTLKQQPPVYSWANLNLLHMTMLILQPLVGFYFLLRYFDSFSWQSFALALPMHLAGAYGITFGYHRMWSHRAFKGTTPVRLLMAICGASAMQGSIRWWSRGHRYHHRYTDTSRDPYNSINGLFFAHLGWMLFNQERPRDPATRVDISDLEGDWVVRWQHKLYLPTALFFSLVLPSLIAGYFWNDAFGGFVIAGIIRQFALHHCTFCINSLAHAFGAQNYDDKLTPRDHVFVALVTFGEGYHNFHHQFPNDYRNGVRYYHFDPTKWLVWLMASVGLVYDVKTFPTNEINKCRVNMLQKRLDIMKQDIVYGPTLEDLPEMSWLDFRRRCKEGEALTVVFGIVHDISEFLHQHPGGEALLKSAIGRDVTNDFTGNVYDHSRAAQNLLSLMRVGRLQTMDKKID